MKSAKFFLGAMYLHLILSIAVPLVIILAPHWDGGQGLFFFYLVFIGVLFILGCVAVAMAAQASRRDLRGLWSAWKLLKLWSIPFFVLNFIYSVFAWLIILAASRGILFMLLPIPIAITCALILQTGCVGCFAVKALRAQTAPEMRPDRAHYLLQLLPVLDVISTLMLARRIPDYVFAQDAGPQPLPGA